MSKRFLSLLGMTVSRGIYVILGMIIAVKFFTVRVEGFIGPDFGEMAECVDYQDKEDVLIGQVCHFENEYMYSYLPDKIYFLHLLDVCSNIIDDIEKESNEDDRMLF